jgi:holo-[acyl-carrier protein] synthase
VQVGFDLMQISQVEDSVRRFGERYLGRVYTDRERREAGSPARLASTFAAKEATLKALRPRSRWVDWREIEIVRDPSGAPAVVLSGEALALARRGRLRQFAVTMTHEADYAGAVVIATLAAPPRAKARRAARARAGGTRHG